MKEDQRVILTKRLLREGLLRLLKKEDISKISVTELCQESGINRATFYRHYQQPRDIIADIRHELFKDVSRLAKEKKALEDPQKWLQSMCQYFYERADVLKVMFVCRTDEEFVSFINETYRSHINELRGYANIAKLDDEELKLTTYCLAGGVYYVLRQWIVEPIDKTPQEIASIIYRLLPLQ